MKSAISNIRIVGTSIFMLVYFSTLFNNVLFVHSHWYDGNLIALHAHPYNLNFDQKNNNQKNNHSNEEYDLYDLIYNIPILELEFFDFELSPFYNECHFSFPQLLNSFESIIISFHQVRGPPVMV